MRRSMAVFAILPFALGLGGCIDSSIDVSASLPPAFPLAEGFYKAVNDPKSPAFKIVKSGSDYRAIDPAEPNGKGAVFAVMDPERNGVFVAEDKTGANDAKQPHYAYYFLRVDATGNKVDLYDFTKARACRPTSRSDLSPAWALASSTIPIRRLSCARSTAGWRFEGR